MSGRRGPGIFRVLLAVRDLAGARTFYESLLGTQGRPVAEGRVYLDCGPVILGLLDYSKSPEANLPRPSESIYFLTDEITEVHRRATRLGALAKGLLHDDPASPLGEIVTRPWGERSFYVEDPSGNSLCFVETSTAFTGTPEQVERLRRALPGS